MVSTQSTWGPKSLAMAALVSLSSATPLTRSVTALRCLTNPFMGNSATLKPCRRNFLSVKLKTKAKRAKSVIVANSASGSASAEPVTNVRFRLNNLGPQPGSRKKPKRKGRGIAAGQGNSCGFGMRGQKSRSGPGIMRGFEGGQMPLYRRLPKLRGIAGGMRAGLPKYVPVNLKDIEAAGFKEGEEVSLESLKERGLINPSGRERRLPLKILGDGELSVKLNIKARSFSSAAKEKLEAAGCSLTVLPGRKKWVRPSVEKNIARANEHYSKKRASTEEEEEASA